MPVASPSAETGILSAAAMQPAQQQRRIAIVVATVGRGALLAQVAPHWLHQTRRPDAIVVVGADASDVGDLADRFPDIDVMLSDKGSTLQRNAALDILQDRADVVVFFDDDFVPSQTFIETLERLLQAHPDLAVVTGRVLADGIMGPGITYADARAQVEAHDAKRTGVPGVFQLKPTRNAYGCNMVVQTALARDLRFDPQLPLYAWLEDVDLSIRFTAFGPSVACEELVGVHMGAKVGRTPGRRFGYSQIANPAYLIGKRVLPAWDGFELAIGNVAKNLVRSIAPEPHIDRRGRLQGNLIALWDIVRGRSHPQRILDL